MRSNTMRVVTGIAVVAVAVVLLIVLKDDGESEGGSEAANAPAKSERSQGPAGGSKKQHPAIPVIVIEGGEPVGGIEELTYDEGERVRFRVDSDVSDEVHIHGYDLSEDVEAGGSVSFDFPATIEGVFEAELEDRKQQILELTVNS